MFTSARLRLTLLYIGLMAVTLAVVAGGILVLGARQTNRTEDLGLQLRANGLARPIAVAMDRQRAFAADASHELRTPITLVQGTAELLLRHPDASIGRFADIVTNVVEERGRLRRLVSALLTLAQADSGATEIERHEVDLPALVAELAADFEPLAREKGLHLETAIGPNVTVLGDADRLRELGIIFLDNAVRYTESGGVRMRVAPAGHAALLAVSDTGRGIDGAHLRRVFDRFYRTGAARTVSQGDAGLGLALTRTIAEAHHGRINIESAPGRGSTFTVHLPSVHARRPSPAEGAIEVHDRDGQILVGARGDP